METLLRILAVLLLVLANGFFVTTEFAIVSVRNRRFIVASRVAARVDSTGSAAPALGRGHADVDRQAENETRIRRPGGAGRGRRERHGTRAGAGAGCRR